MYAVFIPAIVNDPPTDNGPLIVSHSPVLNAPSTVKHSPIINDPPHSRDRGGLDRTAPQ